MSRPGSLGDWLHRPEAARELAAGESLGYRPRSEIPEGGTEKHGAYWEKACKGGHGKACAELSLFLSRGWIPAAAVKSTPAELDKRGCALREASSCTALGWRHAQGTEGFARDPKQARALFESACIEGDPKGCLGLYGLVQRGEVPARSPQKEQSLIERACALGSGDACHVAADALAKKKPDARERITALRRKGCESEGPCRGCRRHPECARSTSPPAAVGPTKTSPR